MFMDMNFAFLSTYAQMVTVLRHFVWFQAVPEPVLDIHGALRMHV